MFLAPLQGAPAGGLANPRRCPGLTSRGAFSARTTLSLKLCALELFNGPVIRNTSISIYSERRRSTFNKLEMPACRIGFADLITHLLVILLHIGPKTVGIVRAGNVRCIDIVDEGRDQQDVVISNNVSMSRRTCSKLAKLAHRVRRVAVAIEAYGPIEVFPQFLIAG